ncbi:MAG: hypothetical protein HQK91_15140 [Nitrospirae bacterium]|nr:hypothetical protein [Nitrospirota bacterium]
MQRALRFISKVMPDGHLLLPEDTAKDVGSVFEVILIPFEDVDIYNYTESLAKEKGFDHLTEMDIENIIHQYRGVS